MKDETNRRMAKCIDTCRNASTYDDLEVAAMAALRGAAGTGDEHYA